MPIPAGSTVRYVTPQQVREVLAPDGDDPDESTAASMDDAAIETAITEAADEVDAALVGRYTVPFSSVVPSLVVSVTRDIAAYLAMLTHRRGDPLPQGDPVGLRYGRAKALLTGLGSGSLTLDVDVASSGAVAVANPYEGSLFGLEDFEVRQGPAGWPGPAYFPSGSEWV